MNKIFALKFNHKNEIVIVSEVCTRLRKSSKRSIKRKLSVFLVISVLAGFGSFSPLYASDVGNILPYQTYRDFAQNRGVFQAGASNITLYDKNGNTAGVLDKAPMADFSSVDKK